MIQTHHPKESKLSIIARMGVRYIPFELDNSVQQWMGTSPGGNTLSAVDLITLILDGKARITPPSIHARFMKRLQEEPQASLQLDFSQSFLSCEKTGEKNGLFLCFIREGDGYALKLLAKPATELYQVDSKIPVDELTLDQLMEFMELGHFSNDHPTVKRLIHWFAGKMELWGMAYG